ncbi:MAG TPA: DNA-binding protein [Azospirillum sp.]|nr:DNA-binding protein [Azospirillum sp.]
MNTPPRLRRAEASAYLKNVHGIVRSPATLAKYATMGGGPIFEKAGRTPLYKPEYLDAWARSLLSTPVGSTSELSLAAAAQ